MTAATEVAPASAQPFSGKAVLWMLLVGVFAFAAFTVLLAYAPDLRSGRDGRAHALSRSAIGFAGLVDLARGVGYSVVVGRGAVPPGDGLLILTPEPGTDPDAVADAIKRSPDRSILIVLPKWIAPAAPLHPGWVSTPDLLPADAVARGLPLGLLGGGLTIDRRQGRTQMVIADVESERAGLPVGSVDRRQTVRGEGWTPVFVDADGAWAAARSRARPNVIVAADPDLFNTQGLKDLNRARLALTIFEDLGAGRPVLIDVTLNGFVRSRSILKLAFEPPFLGATLCGLAAAVLMGLHAAARFGAPTTAGRAFALGKRALADNSAALLRMAKREPSMAGPYADLNRQLIARAVAAPRALDAGELDAMIDRLAVKAGQPAQAAALTAQAARTADLPALMAVARKIHEFRRGMTRERS